jgi:hypothetical protein
MMSDAAHRRLRLLGRVRRARGFRLYTERGTRILDLYQDGGRAILGHHGSRPSLELKNATDRGLTAAVPSAWEARVAAAARELISPASTVRIYAGMERTLHLLLRAAGAPAEVADPVFAVARGDSPPGLSLWRPFLPDGAFSFASCRALVPVLPFPGDQPPGVLLVRDTALLERLPQSDIVAPARLAPLSRAIADLAAELRKGSASQLPGGGVPGFSAVGRYLVPQFPASEYDDRFRRFLEMGVLISPETNEPSILPAEISSGEFALLRRAGTAIESGYHHGH